MDVHADTKVPVNVDRGRLCFHPLTVLDEGEDVVVGRSDLDSYIVLPADGAALLQRLRDGVEPDDAARWYAAAYGESVDIDDFVETLRELGFLRESDTLPVESDQRDVGSIAGGGPATEALAGSQPVRWQRLGAAVFSPAALLLYAVLVLAAVGVSVADPAVAPRHQNVFFSSSLLLIELSLFALQIPLVLVHELAHVLAGRRLGLRTRVGISRRLYFLVFETNMNGLVSVPRRKRYLPMLAGMLIDLVVAAVFTIVAWLLRGPGGEIGSVSGLCLALAFTTLLRIAWQLYFFLRTDIYFLVTTVLGCIDLHGTTKQYLANAVNRWFGRLDRVIPEENWHPRDRRVARWYAPLVVAGYVVAVALLIFVMVPIAWTFTSSIIGRVFAGDTSSPGQFWDATILLALNGAQLAFAGVLAIRESRAKTRVYRSTRGRHARRPATRHPKTSPTHRRPRHRARAIPPPITLESS